MARSRKIQEEQALEAAMVAFWQHGYHALGTRQIEAETGITRFTLQTTYGGKMPLFGRALDLYLDQMETSLIPAMADGSIEGLAMWFERRCMPGEMPEASRWGCLMIASINEFGGQSPDVNARSDRFHAMLRKGFSNALAQIDAAGGLEPDLDKTAAVELLVAASIGLNVVVRSAGDSSAGCSVAAGIAKIVRSWGLPNA